MANNIPHNEILDLLTSPGERISSIYSWLTERIWTSENYSRKELSKFFEDGEKQVLKVEDLILSSASRVYNEIVAASIKSDNLLKEFSKSKTAFVIFDGTSLRELPVLKKLALKTGYKIIESSYRVSSLPSDTTSFVEQKIIGKKVAPSQLESRKELKEKKIKFFYYDSPIRHFDLSSGDFNYLLWSAFPDGTYMNFEAKNSLHFETIVKQFDTAWKNIIISIPNDYNIIITSDHGYVYLNAGYESNQKAEIALNILRQERFRYFEAEESTPKETNEIQIIQEKNLAMLRGRIKNRPKGQTSNKVFRHGGLSLMEMLTPWLVIKKLK